MEVRRIILHYLFLSNLGPASSIQVLVVIKPDLFSVQSPYPGLCFQVCQQEDVSIIAFASTDEDGLPYIQLWRAKIG
jgi:hypothetical protein